ncbi:butyryl-CoA dehydrogenase [Dethiosulfatibacter aminovorans DSM 17477]|uniref:Butyryl-CoA dehydrogenase n=1 Tax=Dethiosulfatibacter aminovorans DSM 17477 TaxID=1121476 RepID=A0A1M6BXV5_9FIRM|nr:acyl-CoA dehydrogenase family protein [Dethiosulfatibacter aminovorans]SHI53451.1 butyryl-CoA dehydrogenase [Dethiosulfatibacter aminovorans DSM 17477]
MFEKKHEMIRKLAREFAENEIAPRAQEIDKTGEYPADLREKLIKSKFHCVTIPEEYGGCGGDYKSAAIVTEEIAAKCGSSVTQIMPNSLSGGPLIYFGNHEQKKKYLQGMAEGSLIGAFGITEPGAGSDASSIDTVAEKDGDDYILNGRKCFITNGPICDFITVFAKTDTKAKGVSGISAFIVEADWNGFSRGKNEDKLGIKGSKTSDIILENVRVPKENLLGREGQGFKICMGVLDSGRITVASQGLGLAQGALDEAVKFTKERIQFGKSIAKFQNTQFEIADMATKVQCGRHLVFNAAHMKDSGRSYTKEAAMAKYYCGELCNEISYRSLQLHGGYGFIKDYDIERIYRDSRIVSIYEGTSEIQKLVISGMVYAGK